jgi:hypothetical protein
MVASIARLQSPLNFLMNIKKDIETLIDASKEVGLEINVEKTKDMLLSRHQECRSKSGRRNNKQIR